MRQYHHLFRSMTMKKNGHATATTQENNRAPVTTQENNRAPATTKKNAHTTATTKKNGQTAATMPVSGLAAGSPSYLRALLHGLQAMRDGDFSVRLPGDWMGLGGKVADTFNEIVAANQKMAQELQRVGQVVGKEGKTRERARFDQSRGAWGEMEG
jgi:hypothetical protein